MDYNDNYFVIGESMAANIGHLDMERLELFFDTICPRHRKSKIKDCYYTKYIGPQKVLLIFYDTPTVMSNWDEMTYRIAGEREIKLSIAGKLAEYEKMKKENQKTYEYKIITNILSIFDKIKPKPTSITESN